MSKVTSKHQVSIPKALAEKLGIGVGDELQWEEAAGTLRARVAGVPKTRFSKAERLRLFDRATHRQAAREAGKSLREIKNRSKDRGWTREDLYTR